MANIVFVVVFWVSPVGKILHVFIIYGMTGDSGAARDFTNDVIDAIREEIDLETFLPTIIGGDFNNEPDTITSDKDMIDEEAWTEIGSNAHWWGGERKQMTCWS